MKHIDHEAWFKDAEHLMNWATRSGDGWLMYEAQRALDATDAVLDTIYEQTKPHGSIVPTLHDIWATIADRGTHGGYYSLSDSLGRPHWGD